MEDAVSDFAAWEPGLKTICVLCNGERGGNDPPGPWIRHRSILDPTFRRRIPIYDGLRPWKPLGYFVYERD